MQIPSRFTIGVHALLVIALEANKCKVTSDFIAGSVGVNPVIIRKTLSQLRDAGLVTITRGKGGASLAKNPQTISLLDIYLATDSQGGNGQLFGFHDKINPDCSIGQSLHLVLDERLLAAQKALEERLANQNLADLVAEANENRKKITAL